MSQFSEVLDQVILFGYRLYIRVKPHIERRFTFDEEQSKSAKTEREVIKFEFDLVKNIILLSGIKYLALKSRSPMLTQLYIFLALSLGFYIQTYFRGISFHILGKDAQGGKSAANILFAACFAGLFYFVVNHIVSKFIGKFASLHMLGG